MLPVRFASPPRVLRPRVPCRSCGSAGRGPGSANQLTLFVLASAVSPLLQAQQEEVGGDLAWKVLQVSAGMNHTAAVVELAGHVHL